ncbi:efflux transporter outer membrane subunit [uncultured Ferrimonas sp.]|uniref:efflux transporter outer membrane subunit n=1 Tax=uncultured Ferrimonas sp. TaxID=432640 RepID=UPI002616E8EE|nr:efflux transporter outer membrane subunit [uncultured Ferrimonas sp.]
MRAYSWSACAWPRLSLLMPLLSALTLSGCINLAPDYQRPAAPIPAQWPQAADNGEEGEPAASSGSQAELDWRQFVLSPQLQQLIELGLQHNRDLRIAAHTLRRSQAQYGVQRAQQFPNVDANVGAQQQRLPEAVSAGGPASISRQYSANLGLLSYELDFFGRISNLEQQALFSYLASEQGRRNTEITVINQIASRYLSLAANHALVALAQETLDSQQDSLRLTQQSFDNGVVSGLDVAQAQVTVATAQVDLARFKSSLAQDRNALAVLVGTGIRDDLLPSAAQSVSSSWLAPLQVGLPSSLLRLRPDVVQAEYQLMGNNANIGAARAAYFPSISLTATAGVLSSELDDLFSGDARSWNFSPSLSVPIFHWGELDANVAIAKANSDIALATYEQTIQNAFREVADSLAARRYLAQQYQAQQALVAATGESFQLSELRFRQGVDSFYNVLDSQRSYFSAQQQLISLDLSQQTNLLTLFRALGGGWRGNPLPPLPSP